MCSLTNILFAIKSLQESAAQCTPKGRDCYARFEEQENSCRVDCEGLYADVEFENLTNYENVKNSLIFESLNNAYSSYKDSFVKSLVLKESGFETESLDYHPLQAVQIYFSTATYDEIGKDASVTFENQISAIGGTMGLFAGFSILSAVEVFYFILKFLFSLMSRRNVDKKINFQQ